tara:strand:+ start:31 stop:480 length:450 start_codon:yes stop_codon:yes gene_type:complete
MIRYIDGDLVRDADQYDVIVHGANCFNTMGAGIAPQIKNKFPEAYKVDCDTVSGDKDKLGTISHTLNTKPIVVNLYSQYGFNGRKHGETDLDYEALRSGLKLVKEKFSGKFIGMPKIGSGLAGGDWSKIEKIIEEELSGEYVVIVNYVP